MNSRGELDHFGRSARNGFGATPLARAAQRRRDADWVEARLADPETRFVPVWRSKVLARRDGDALQPAYLDAGAAAPLREGAESLFLLGLDGKRALFGLDLPAGSDEAETALKPLGRFYDLRMAGSLLDAAAGAVLAHARAMAHWHCTHRFCGACGAPTASREAGHLRVCTDHACARAHFPRTDPAVIVAVTHGARLLLARQPHWPPKRHSVLAGFVEPGETLEEAVVREVAEEAGLRLQRVHYHSSQPWPFPASLMLGFTAEAEDEAIRLLDQELEDARWVERDGLTAALNSEELLLPPPLSIAFRLIEDWFDPQGRGTLRALVEAPSS